MRQCTIIVKEFHYLYGNTYTVFDIMMYSALVASLCSVPWLVRSYMSVPAFVVCVVRIGCVWLEQVELRNHCCSVLFVFSCHCVMFIVFLASFPFALSCFACYIFLPCDLTYITLRMLTTLALYFLHYSYFNLLFPTAFAPKSARVASSSLKMSSIFPENPTDLTAGEVSPTGFFDPLK